MFNVYSSNLRQYLQSPLTIIFSKVKKIELNLLVSTKFDTILSDVIIFFLLYMNVEITYMRPSAEMLNVYGSKSKQYLQSTL
jgi:hypothetical protein